MNSGKSIVILFFAICITAHSQTIKRSFESESGISFTAGIANKRQEKIPDQRDKYGSDPRIVNIGDRKQLFFDNYIIDTLKSVFRILNKAVKYAQNPLIRLNPPQEAGSRELGIVSGSVIYDEDEKKFKMWYDAEPYSWDHGYLGYAVSEDGIKWDFPAAGSISYEGYTAKNLVFTRGEGELMPAVIKDYHEKDPSRRYKMLYRLAGDHYRGIAQAFSADGINWKPEGKEIIPFSDSPNSMIWDDRLNKYIAHTRKWETIVFADGQRYYTRVVLQSESSDFRTWKEDNVILRPDDRDPQWSRQFYNMEWMPYEDIYIGFISVYHTLPGMEPVYTPGPEWMDKLDIQLAYSRDGMNWSREESREVFLEDNCDPGKFDASMIYVMQHPLVVGDEIWIYYTGFRGHHWATEKNEVLGSAVGLAKLRLDGFVSLDAGRGIITTKPLIIKGNRLIINADASLGSLAIEVLDMNGKPLPGFSKGNAEIFKGDAVRHACSWNSSTDCSELQNYPVILKFYMDHCKLYSFRFLSENE